MTDQETQELSMDEILTSIRDILSDKADSDINKTVVFQKTNNDQSVTPFVAIQPDIAVKQKETPDSTEEEIANICNNIRHLMNKPHLQNQFNQQQMFDSVVTPPTIPLKTNNSTTKINNNISSDILDDFAAIFAKRRQQYPQTDSSVRNIAEAAVLNEVVPVLQQWLQEKLPQTVQKEIERVMAKAGMR